MKKYHSISSRFLLWTVPLLLISLAVMTGIIYVIEQGNQKNATIAIGQQATEQTAVALENWIADQVRIVQMIASQNLVIAACKDPGNPEAVTAAQTYVQSIHNQFPYYENVPLFAKMAGGKTADIQTPNGIKQVGDGQIFVDTVGSKTIGKGGPSLSYVKAVFSGKDYFISQVYPSLLRGNPIFVIAAPVKDETGQLIGVAAIAPQMSFFTDIFVSKIAIGKTGYLFFIDDRGMMLAHRDKSLILNKEVREKWGTLIDRILSGDKLIEASNNGSPRFYITRMIQIPDEKILHKWVMVFGQDQEEVMASSSHFLKILSLISLILLACFCAGLYFLCRMIVVNPVNQTMLAIKDIAQGEGDLTKRLNASSRNEIGELSRWFNVFIERLQTIVRKISATSGAIDSSSTLLSRISESLLNDSGATSSMAASVTGASEEMNTNLASVVQSMEDASANAHMVASAAEEINSTIHGISQNAEKARDVSRDAVNQAGEASKNMADLGTAVDKIGKVTETITDISDQTNLLSLNATIEAARAGEAGKGFAVVANEIKELAKQTASATLEIKTLIEAVQNTTGKTGDDITRISEVISGVNETVGSIAVAVEEQTATTSEIATNITQTSESIRIVNETVNQSSALASNIAGDIAQVSTASRNIEDNSRNIEQYAQELMQHSTELNEIVSGFKV